MQVFEHYKNLHKNPELSGCEFLTAKYIKNVLSDIGYTPYSVGETGVFADLSFEDKLPWLLFRADIDALAIKEDTSFPYASQEEIDRLWNAYPEIADDDFVKEFLKSEN